MEPSLVQTVTSPMEHSILQTGSETDWPGRGLFLSWPDGLKHTKADIKKTFLEKFNIVRI